jgi:hypothetical protein
MDDFPSVVQECSECASTPTTPHEDVKKPILLTCDVEEVAMIAQFVDSLRRGKRRVRTVALKSVEIRKRNEEAGGSNRHHDDEDQSAPTHDLTRKR